MLIVTLQNIDIQKVTTKNIRNYLNHSVPLHR
nr:MAG TPA: hypothetical protein [Caudoviricetes sp.]DAP10660.1 MAG TPA: hypothetical protein [Caudoviricetes sp.]DAR09892.1 MAG TPA: hypothetical protein [Caudoviricetes sp.]